MGRVSSGLIYCAPVTTEKLINTSRESGLGKRFLPEKLIRPLLINYYLSASRYLFRVTCLSVVAIMERIFHKLQARVNCQSDVFVMLIVVPTLTLIGY